MSDPLLLVDSDVFVLLAAADLLDSFAESVGIAPANIRRLPALPYQIDRGRSLRKQFSIEALGRARRACDRYQSIESGPDDLDRVTRFQQVPLIDDGEALLFSLLCEQPLSLLTTGDKRALIALAGAKSLSADRDLLCGRIVSLEAALLRLVKHLGAEEVGRRFCPLWTTHATVEVIFGHKAAFDDTECLRQLTSYLGDLIRQVGSDLFRPD